MFIQDSSWVKTYETEYQTESGLSLIIQRREGHLVIMFSFKEEKAIIRVLYRPVSVSTKRFLITEGNQRRLPSTHEI